MTKYRRKAHVDWVLGGLIFFVCAVLTILQYRWTGRVARSEATRIQASLQDQTQAMADAFDNELEQNCMTLLPAGGVLTSGELKYVLLVRFREWKAAKRPPLFAHMDLAVPAAEGLELFELDQKAEDFTAAEWPVAWSALQDNLSRKRTGGSPPYSDPGGTLVEFPIYGAFQQPGGESGWMIVQLDLDYVHDTWLPELVQRYLAFSGKPINDVLVRTASNPSSVLYSQSNNRRGGRTPLVSVRFNELGRTPQNLRGPAESGHWVVETWQRPGALEAIVAVARWRNFAIAGMLSILMLATGIALVLHTRSWRQLAEAQMKFVANVSHEFRTPLTVIRGAAHNLKRGIVHEDGQVEQYSKLIIEHADDLTEMVEQVLALAGAQKRWPAASNRRLAPSEVLYEAVAATAEETKNASCAVHVELPPRLPPIVGEATALRRVFENLISNAAKHGGQGGWIGISGASHEDSVPPTIEIRVADHGRGIPPDEQEEIFHPFFRGASAQAKQIRGSGLGLSLVREIVEAHGGMVSVHSESGKGTIFTVRLPAVSSTEAQ